MILCHPVHELVRKFMKRPFIIIVLVAVSCVGYAQDLKKVKITEVESFIANSKTPLIINFWATFCKPCMAEIPHFQKMAEKYKSKGLQVIFISLDMQDDYPGNVSAFIKKRKMSTWWLDETNADYFCPKIDQAWSGVIPATVFINNKNGYRKFIEESLTESNLEEEIKAVISN